MKFEQDEVELIGGVRHGRTLGGPVAIQIGNTEWPKWDDVMSPDPVGSRPRRLAGRTGPQRPAHPPAARARRPRRHAEVRLRRRPAGARARQRPRDRRPRGARRGRGALPRAGRRRPARLAHVVDRPGRRARRTPRCRRPTTSPRSTPTRCAAFDAGDVGRRWSPRSTQRNKDGDTLGGVVEVLAYGLPPGLGSHVHWDRRLDARLAGALMGIQAIKGVEVGDGFRTARAPRLGGARRDRARRRRRHRAAAPAAPAASRAA